MLGLVYLFVAAFWFNASVGGLMTPGLENAPWDTAKILDVVNHLSGRPSSSARPGRRS